MFVSYAKYLRIGKWGHLKLWTLNPIYFDILETPQTEVCRAVGPTLAASLEPWLIEKVWPAGVFSTGITLVDVHILVLVDGVLVIQIFLSPFLDITRMPMSTVTCFTQLDSRFLCLQIVPYIPTQKQFRKWQKMK